MPRCDELVSNMEGLNLDCPPTIIGCVPVTDGLPITIPEIDEFPIHYDPDTECIWLYVCDDVGWKEFCGGGEDCCVSSEFEDNAYSFGACSGLNSLGTNYGKRHVDSHEAGDWAGTAEIPWTVTNPSTTVPSLLTVNAQWTTMFVEPIKGLSGSNQAPDNGIYGTVNMMIGVKDRVERFTPEVVLPTGPRVPYNDVQISSSQSVLPVNRQTMLFGEFITAPGVNHFDLSATSSNMTFIRVIPPGGSLEMSQRMIFGLSPMIDNMLNIRLWVFFRASYVVQTMDIA